MPVTVLMLLFSPRAGAAGERLGVRTMLTVGPLVAALGVGLLSRVGPGAASALDVLAPVALLGAGLTITVTPLTTTVLGSLADERAGLASGVNNAAARTGGLLLVALLPALTGLGDGGFADPASVGPAFRIAMLVCAGLLVAAALVAALALEGRPTPSGTASSPTCPRRHCAVDGPPLAVVERSAAR
jgi:hypothetical protein